MLNQLLTGRQTKAILIMFIFGSSAVLGVSNNIAQDAWIALVIGFLFALPILMVYARLSTLNSGASIFRIFEQTMGKPLGKVATALMTWYALHLCALVMRNFSEFLMITSLFGTPQVAVLVVMLVAVGMLAKCGGKALGKWSIVILPIVLGIVTITIVLSFNLYRYNYILPVFEHKVTEVLESAFQVFSFPFGETVLLLGIADLFDTNESTYKVYFFGLLFSACVLLLITLRNLLVLGPSVMSACYFPSYMAARIISVGDFLSRIEGSISANFILAGFTKITLCLIVASRGLASLFQLPDWRNFVFPTGSVVLALALILYENTMDMYTFLTVYPFYAFPFQVVLPVISWILSEVRARKKKPADIAAGVASA